MTMSTNEQNREPEKREESVNKQMKKVKTAEKHVKNYQFFLLRVILLLAVIWVLFFQVIGLTHMPTGDMSPRIDLGDFVMFYRLDKNVSNKDVIVLEKETPDSEGQKQIFICRVVALPGDTVEITENGSVKVNGNTLIEDYIYSMTMPYDGFTAYPLTLGEDECFVLADKRDSGSDSRWFGPVEKNEILGTVITIMRRNNL